MKLAISKPLTRKFIISGLASILTFGISIFGFQNYEFSRSAELYSHAIREPLLVGDAKQVRATLLQSLSSFTGISIVPKLTNKESIHGQTSWAFVKKKLFFDEFQREELATIKFYYDPTSTLILFGISTFLITIFTYLTAVRVQTQIDFDLERKREEERLRATEKVSKQLGHDLKSPLSALNMIAASISGDPDRSQLLREVIKRINGLANDLLELKNVQPIVLNRSSLDSIITSIINEKKYELDRSITLNFNSECQSDLYSTATDIELARILSNLINNAAEAFNGASGLISISLKKTSEKTATITVSDNGPGIPTELLKLLGTEGRTTKLSGHGLGLSGAKQILKKCDGKLAISSQVGLGTTVAINLPIS